MTQHRRRYQLKNRDLNAQLEALVRAAAEAYAYDGEPETARQILVTALRLMRQNADEGDMRLINASLKELRQTANQLLGESIHVDEVVQHDTSTWNVHLSAKKEGKRILRALDNIEKWQKEMVAQRGELDGCDNSARVNTLTRMIQGREKKILETFMELHLAPAQV